MQILIDIVIALITGVISGALVDIFARKREEMRTTYQFWYNYLFDQMKAIDMYIDSKALYNMPKFKNEDKHFQDTIFEIMDYQCQQNSDDRECSDEEIQHFNNILTALKELNKWQTENKFWLFRLSNVKIRKSKNNDKRKGNQK